MKALFVILALAVLILPVCCNAKTLYTYDLTELYKLDMSDPAQARSAWDQAHFVCTLQGIVNRKVPELYIFFTGYNDATDSEAGADHFWLDKMTAKGEWLHDCKIVRLESIDQLIKVFRKQINGLSVYDENVPATSNAAATSAGINNMPAIRFDPSEDSLYYHLTKDPKGPKLPVKVWLVRPDGSPMFTGKGTIPGTKQASTGSAKCDVYLWAKEKFLDSGKCNPHVLGYYLDCSWVRKPFGRLSNFTLTNQDYVVAKKGFFFDLSPWDDEPATDEPSQPLGADTGTLKAILLSAYKQNKGGMIQAAGFLPWDRKYTGHAGGKHGDVEGEWKYAEILSCYNAYMDADALGLSGMANASVFSLFPLKEKYPQKKPTLNDLKKAGYIEEDGSVKKATYITYYVGDYDAAAWLYQRMPEIWESSERGSIPLGWAFNPNLSERFAYGMHYIRSTATPNDYFMTGDVGAGYINPSHLAEPRQYSGLPSGISAWEKHCRKWMDKFDLSVVGFIIDGNAPAMNEDLFDMYSRLAPDGIGGQKLPAHDGVYKDTMPYIKMQADVYDPEQHAIQHSDYMGKYVPEFYMFRNILWTVDKQKTFYETLKKNIDGPVELLSPYHFFLLLKYFHQNGAKTYNGTSEANLFDIRRGIKITSHSPIIDMSDIRDIFGGENSTVESGKVLFADDRNDTHFVEWELPEPAEISTISLMVQPDGSERKRHTPHFVLKTRSSIEDEWQVVISEDIPFPPKEKYTFSLPRKLKATYFRAEFAQDTANGAGPRIVEIKGE